MIFNVGLQSGKVQGQGGASVPLYANGGRFEGALHPRRHLLVNTSRVNNIGRWVREKNEHWPPPQYSRCFFKILGRFYLFILCFPLRVRLIDRSLLHVHPITVVIYAPRFFDFVQFPRGLGFPLSVSRTSAVVGRQRRHSAADPAVTAKAGGSDK